MARTTTTRRSYYETPEPRPIGQSVWLLATAAMAAVIVFGMGDALTAVQGSASQPSYSSQQLLDLAASASTTTTNPAASATAQTTPAAPVLVAEGSTPTTSIAVTDSQPTATETTDAVETINEAPTESTTTVAATPAVGDYEAHGQAALATISYPWQQLLPGWTISFGPEKSGLYGLTMVPDEKIEIYVREGQSLELLAHVIAHELGHAVDVTLNDGPDRRLWEEARGLDSEPWWPGSGATDFSTGAGDFAEAFAAWQVGEQSFRSKLAGAPNAAQIELLAQLSAG